MENVNLAYKIVFLVLSQISVINVNLHILPTKIIRIVEFNKLIILPNVLKNSILIKAIMNVKVI